MRKLWQNLEGAESRGTPQRLAICQGYSFKQGISQADKIYEEVEKKCLDISLATVYQTLHLLSKIVLVQEIKFSDGVSWFDLNTSSYI
ncbi:MAG: transcriptional repressor [Candidatus Bathyarchaeia archaeon]